MKKKELVTLLKTLLAALVEAETPKPRPAAPLVPTSGWTMTENLRTGEIRVNGQPAFFIPKGYQREEDGYWIPWYDPRRW
jgi:hypothetical protein